MRAAGELVCMRVVDGLFVFYVYVVRQLCVHCDFIFDWPNQISDSNIAHIHPHDAASCSNFRGLAPVVVW